MGRSAVSTKWHITGTFIGEHSPTPSTSASVNTRTSAVRVLRGYALTSVIFTVMSLSWRSPTAPGAPHDLGEPRDQFVVRRSGWEGAPSRPGSAEVASDGLDRLRRLGILENLRWVLMLPG